MNDPPDDQQALDLLDDYLARLQAGEAPDRDALLREHPELTSALDCLEALEDLAPPSTPKTGGGKDDTLEVSASMG